jgi:phage-related protein
VSKKPDKALAILSGEIKTPPLSTEARREAGFLLRRLQQGELIPLPHSRPMTKAIGARRHELRIQDENATSRIMYRIDPDEILILDVFSKKAQTTPVSVIDACKSRLKTWDQP